MSVHTVLPRHDGVELSSKPQDLEDRSELAQQAEALLDRQADSEHQDAEAGPSGEHQPVKAPLLARTWKHQTMGLLVLLVLMASGLAIAAYVFGLDDMFESRKLNFLVVGDWGRDGNFNQSLVAAAMGKEARGTNPLFIISVGDNFYESGLTSAEDEQFSTSFTNVYADPHLQVPWFSILGNHDYGEMWNISAMPAPTNCKGVGSAECYYSPLHQLNATLSGRDWRWHCERFYQRSLARGMIEIFFIDTSPAIQTYHREVWASNKGGISEQSWDAQVLELEGHLAASKARWKLVVGHHPVLNNHWPDTPELVASLKPLLNKYGVQAYFSGHEHMLQHLHERGTQTHYLVSGGGSLTDYPIQLWASSASQMQHAGSGFVSCSITLEHLNCKYFGLLSAQPFYMVTIPVS